MTDWPSFAVNLATALFTGGTLLLGIVMRPRVRWSVRISDANPNVGDPWMNAKITNVGNTAALDVIITSNHELNNQVFFPNPKHFGKISQGEAAEIKFSVLCKRDEDTWKDELSIREDSTITVSWHQMPFLKREKKQVFRMTSIPNDCR
ncbi:MAG: hypothetical protein L0K03_01245 [Bifidobacterium crudilactis]|nr:hypothetical protein [Bifidobacterium crudilactis]